MKICLAQTRPIKGDIPANIRAHVHWIEVAAQRQADLIVFPELSITGYEPALAEQLATTPADHRFAIFQTLADTHELMIGIGVPLRNLAGVSISLLFFLPHRERQVYAKKYLHPDEVPYFVPGTDSVDFSLPAPLALAICYELSVPEHARAASRRGAGIYLASVAKSAVGMQQARERLGEISRTYTMATLLVNGIGPSDDFVGAGQSFILNSQGELLAQLGEEQEGMLWFDTATQEVSTDR